MSAKINDGLSNHQRYARRHPERLRAIRRVGRKKNAVKINAAVRAYRMANGERIRETNRAYCNKNRDRVRAWVRKSNRKREIGVVVSEQQVQQLIQLQDNRCGICKDILKETRALDHSHVTGQIRGVLCRKCNLALGGFGDSVARLAAAISYLNRWEEQCARSA